MDSHKPRTLERNRFMEAPWQRAALACGLTSVAAIMPQAPRSGKPRQGRANSCFSAKRNEWLMRT
jgi:hypothetical protein